jgi:hypothetical protein
MVAPAVHLGIEHFQGPAAGVDLVVMGEIGEPSRTRNRSSFQGPRRIFTPQVYEVAVEDIECILWKA